MVRKFMKIMIFQFLIINFQISDKCFRIFDNFFGFLQMQKTFPGILSRTGAFSFFMFFYNFFEFFLGQFRF